MSATDLDAFKARLPLAEIVGRYVPLRRQGRELVALCPFHREKTPSFTVVEDKGFYHCFGCGAHGNAIDFVMAMEGIGFREALERLEELTGIPAPRPRGGGESRQDAELWAVHAAARDWFRARLLGPEGERARRYLEARGVARASWERFELGYAPAARDALRRALAARGWSETVLLRAGLLAQGEGGEPYDRFRDRLIFPIADRRGRVVGFGGRALGEARAKYLNSPETPLFRKGELLFNLHRAARPARSLGRLYVVEGFMDVIALSEAGLEAVVAPLGTALSPPQLRLLWQLVDEPVLCFDGDGAGRRAAWRAALRALPLLQAGKTVRFLLLPEGEDPDSLVRGRGAEAFSDLARTTVPLVDFLFAMEAEAAAPTIPERRAGLRQRLRQLLREIGDPELRRDYAASWRRRLAELVPPTGHSMIRNRRRNPPERFDAALRAAEREAALHLLRPLLRDPGLLAAHEEALAALELADPEGEALRQEILHWYAAAASLDPRSLRDHLTAHGFAELVEEMVAGDRDAAEDSGGGFDLEEWRETLARLERLAAQRREARGIAEVWRRRDAGVSAAGQLAGSAGLSASEGERSLEESSGDRGGRPGDERAPF